MPRKPNQAFIDADSLLFKAASVAEDIVYTLKNKNTGEVVKEFGSAKACQQFLELVSVFEYDPEGSYKGVGDDLEREVGYVLHSPEKAYKAFDKLLDEYKAITHCDTNTFYVSKASGLPNFRHKIATLTPYKCNRGGRKPAALEAVRKYAYKHPEVKVPRGQIEVDDRVMAMARKAGAKGLVVAVDKDVLQATGCWVLHVGNHGKPVWSDPKIVGTIDEGKGGYGLGWLWLLYQCIAGDSADTYKGVEGVGEVGARKLLSKYSGLPVERIIEPVTAVANLYRDVYGDKYNYFNQQTGSFCNTTWRELFIEMLHLAYMRDSESVECPLIQIVREI